MRLIRSCRGQICLIIREVRVNTRRYVAGVDWQASERVSAYLRYTYEDYDDASASYNSGRAHMVLAGLTGTR